MRRPVKRRRAAARRTEMGRRAAALAGLVAVATAAGCSGEPTAIGDPPGPGDGLGVQVVADGLTAPLHLVAPPGDGRLFVVEQPGRIRIVKDGTLLSAPFLDLTDRVRSGGERGLLGLAFHPDYAQNGHFYVNYTDEAGDTRVERYTVSADPDRADPASALLILAVEQPFANHNGGLLAFGPDGMLYLGMGDGGSAGDPQGHGQDRSTLLGALLRLDVDGGEPYAVPPDNPFEGEAGARAEIWAFGLRNPWRFSFDPPSGTLYIADVGQNRREEVNARPAEEAGLDYGWNVMEGSLCFEPPGGCDAAGRILPVLEYGRDDGCSVIGGHVYRGAALDFVRGHYFYGDFCGGWVRSFRLEGGEAVDGREWALGDLGQILSFGRDDAGELYVLSANGRVYRLVRTP